MNGCTSKFDALPFTKADIDETSTWDLTELMTELRPGEAIWTRFHVADEVGELWSSDGCACMGDLLFRRTGPHQNIFSLPLHIKRVGRYVRTFCLWKGPSFKLADWKQLPAGSKMLLSPEPCELEEDLAHFRAAYLRRAGIGHFDLLEEGDGSLWVGRS